MYQCLQLVGSKEHPDIQAVILEITSLFSGYWTKFEVTLQCIALATLFSKSTTAIHQSDYESVIGCFYNGIKNENVN